MKKMLRTVAITIPFLLFMSGEQHAHPLSEILRGEAEPRPVEQTLPSPAVKRAAPARKHKKAGAARKRPRNLTTAKKQRRRKARRNSDATVAAGRLHILKREYARRTRRPLVITSFRRTAAGQARAIRKNAKVYGVPYVLRVYRGSPAIREILRAYRANRRSARKAEQTMTRVIESQVARGVYVSDHMLGRAVDIRSRGRYGARLSVLRTVARDIGGKVLVEKDHYHFKLV